MKEIDIGETVGIKRRLDDLGRIVFPKEFRKELNINEGDKVEIFLVKNGIFVKKIEEGDENMFIKKEDYKNICDRSNNLKQQLEEANQRIEELSISRTSAMAECIERRESEQSILEIIESNSYGRTYEQKLAKIKELISKNGTSD